MELIIIKRGIVLVISFCIVFSSYAGIITTNNFLTTQASQTDDNANHNWWNTRYNFRKKITIDHPLNGYQMEIIVYKIDGYDDPSNGIIDCENHCKDDFSDLRFIDEDNNSISYWISYTGFSSDDKYANIWLNTTGTTSIYLYYGYEYAQPFSNASRVFLWHDDFNDGLIDGWRYSYSSGGLAGVSESGGLLDVWSNGNSITGEKHAYISSREIFEQENKLIARISSNYDWHRSWEKRFGFGEGSDFGDSSGIYVHHDKNIKQYRSRTDRSTTSVSLDGSIDSLKKVEIHRINNSSLMFRKEDTSDRYLHTNIPTQNFSVFASSRDDADCGALHIYLDYVAIGKSTDIEPIWNNIYSEQINPKRTDQPNVFFEYSPENPTQIDTISFYDYSYDPEGSIISWNWSFGDGNYSNIKNSTHIYTNPRQYVVTLNVTNDVGISNETSKQIIISSYENNEIPKISNPCPANNSYDISINGTAINFEVTDEDNDDLWVEIWSNHTGNWIKYAGWNIGSNQEQNVLVDSDNDNDWDVIDTSFYVNSDGWLKSGSYGFYGNASVTHLWNMTDYSKVYYWTVNVTDNSRWNNQSYNFITENMANIPPVANFSFTADELKVGFTDNSYDPDGIIRSWYWDFGDDMTIKTQNPTYTYSEEGMYLVSLTVIDDRGDSNSISKMVRVTEDEVGIVYIDDDYNNKTSGFGVDRFNKIQDGINNVSNGGTVNVKPGVYYENIIVNKTLYLIGENKDTTKIDGKGEGFVILVESDNCYISHFTIENSGDYYGIKINSNSNNVKYNTIRSNYYGIWANNTDSNIIRENIISYNIAGIKIKDSTNTELLFNQIKNNDIEGLKLENSPNTYVGYNDFIKNGISVSGPIDAWNTHTILGNDIDGKTIYYQKNKEGWTVPDNAGQIILANSSNVVIENQEFSDIENAIQLSFSKDNIIKGCSFNDLSESAIKLYCSDENTIIDNTIISGNGIDIYDSDSNDIIDNSIVCTDLSINIYHSQNNYIKSNIINNNKFGILLHSYSNRNNISNNIIRSNSNGGIWFISGCSQNIIIENTISSNGENNPHDANIYLMGGCKGNIFTKNTISSDGKTGIYIEYDLVENLNNKIYHNNFLNNSRHACDKNNDIWDNDYPSGGNYWDDYAGLDNNEDDIGDNSYDIPGGENKDNYPFMNKYGWNKKPDIPFNPIPKDNLENVDINSNLFWECIDPENDDLTYDVYFGENNNPGLFRIEQNNKTLEPGVLNYDTRYYWKIVVKDLDHDHTVIGPIWQFTTKNGPPNAGFSYSPKIPNKNQEIFFTDSSSDYKGSIVEWYWDFGDGTISNEQNPSHIYKNSGTYLISLMVTDDDGATDVLSKSIFVDIIKPNADFTINPPNPSKYQEIKFIDQSTDSDGFISSWIWDFDDGTKSNDKNPTHIYSIIGTYNITLEVTDNEGGKDTSYKQITIGSDVSYIEDFENDLGPEWTSYSSNVLYGRNTRTTYSSNSGAYSYRMDNTRNGHWNLNELILKVNINDGSYLELGFSTIEYGDEATNIPNSYMDHYNGDGISVSSDGSNWIKIWDYPTFVSSWQNVDPVKIDNHISIDGIVYIKFQQYDNFMIPADGILWDDIVLYSDGEIIPSQDSINQPPNADYSFNPSEPLRNELVQFVDQSTDSDGIISNWVWNFGDGHSSSEKNPTHIYNYNGKYTVSLTVIDNYGKRNAVSYDIKVGNIKPVASFSYIPDNPSFRDTISFIDQSTDSDGTITSWHWDFGDGTISNLKNPTHKYDNSGYYKVTLTATDDKDESNSNINYIYINPNKNPNADIIGSYRGRPNQEITFDASASIDSDGTIEHYRWDFENDGIYDTDWLEISQITHSYSNIGVILVKVQVKDNDGGLDTDTAVVIITNNYPPISIPGGPYRAKVNRKIIFNGSDSYDSDGSIVGYRWDFENDGIYDTAWLDYSTYNYSYTISGNYIVGLEVKDNEGAKKHNTGYVIITDNIAPVANAGGSYYGKTEENIILDASSSYDLDGTIVGYRWDFNSDGTYDTKWDPSTSVSHVFNSDGIHTVILQIKDDDDYKDTDNANVVISKNLPPVADAGGPYSANTNQYVVFDGSNSYDTNGTITGYRWDFENDGIYDTDWSMNPSEIYIYNIAGEYTVKLLVRDDDGTTDYDFSTVTVTMNQVPVADPGGPYLSYVNTPITFDGSGSYDPDGRIIGYRWDFNSDSIYDTNWILYGPSYSYSKAGIYTATLEVIDDDGEHNFGTTTVTIKSNDPPVAIAGGPYSCYVEEDITFDGSSSIDPDGSIVGYRWDFNSDGAFDTDWSSDKQVTHSYNLAGSYNIKLEVKDDRGKTDYDTAIVKVMDGYLIGLWHLDEGVGEIAYDSSGNDYDGEIIDAIWSSDGKYNNALRFQPSDSRIEIYEISNSFDSFTYSIWSNFYNLNNKQPLISRKDGAGIGRNIILLEDGTIKSNIGGELIDTGFSPSIYEWHNYVLTYNEDTLKIYVDGNLKKTVEAVEEDATGTIVIGSDKNNYYFIDGLIDEIGFWRRSLSIYEIQNLYSVPNQPSFETPANKTEWVDPDIGRLSVIVSEPYKFKEPTVEETNIENQRYHRVSIEGLDNYGLPGEPNLPADGAYILLPSGTKTENIRVITGEKRKIGSGYNVEPSTLPTIFNSEEIDIIDPDEEIYSSDELFPGKLFTNIGTQRFRGQDILILMLHPVQYLPSTGEVFYYEDMQVLVETSIDESENNMYRGTTADVLAVSSMVDNPSPGINENTVQSYSDLYGNYDMVIITNNNFKNSFEPLKQAHNNNGLKTKIYTVEEIYNNYNGVDNPQKIRNFIRDAYQNLGIEYVLIGGDTNIVPVRNLFVYSWCGGYSSNMPSDLYYSCLDGTYNYDNDNYWGEARCGGLGTDGDNGGALDMIADVYVGRASVGSIQEVENFVTKTVNYMNTDDSDPYLKKVLLVGEYLGFGGVSNYAKAAMEEHRDGSSSSGYTTVGFPSDEYNIDTLYEKDRNWVKSDIMGKINDGVHMINHLGHANYYSNLNMYTSDVGRLSNDKYCFIYSQGCMAGGFDRNDCIAEHFTVKNTKGAIGGVWNARYGWGRRYTTDGPSQRYSREFWDAVFGENLSEMGKANADSKEDNLYRIRGSCMRWCYYETNLFGDPALDLRRLKNEPDDGDNDEEYDNNMNVEFYWDDDTFIGIDEKVRNNSIASVEIDSLNRYSKYKWYVTVDDAFNRIKGPVWWFTVEAFDWDINRDGRCDDIDTELLISQYCESGEPGWIREDIIRDGIIDIKDVSTFFKHYGENYVLGFSFNEKQGTITISSVNKDGIKWDDLEINGDYINNNQGIIEVGDLLSNCYGTIDIIYKPVNTVRWQYSFVNSNHNTDSQVDNIKINYVCDLNNDGIIDDNDLGDILEKIGESGSPGWIDEDINCDGIIDHNDITELLNDYEESNDLDDQTDTTIENEEEELNTHNDDSSSDFIGLNNYNFNSQSNINGSNEILEDEETNMVYEELVNNKNQNIISSKFEKQIRDIKIDKSSSKLISTDGDLIPEFIKNEENDELIPVVHAPGTIKKVEENQDNGDIDITISVQKAKWIYIEIVDQYPDLKDITVKTSDGRVISDDMIWRENGKIYVLDDPDVTYHFIYHKASSNIINKSEQENNGNILLFILFISGIIILIGFIVYIKRSDEFEIKDRKYDKKIDETQRFLKDLDEKINNFQPMSRIEEKFDYKYQFLKMICQGKDVDYIINSLNISYDELDNIVKNTVDLGYLRFINNDEVEITQKGLKYVAN